MEDPLLYPGLLDGTAHQADEGVGVDRLPVGLEHRAGYYDKAGVLRYSGALDDD